MFGLKRPETEKFELSGASVVINHQTRTVFLSVDSAGARDEDFAELSAHYKRQGYYLLVFAPTPVQGAGQ